MKESERTTTEREKPLHYARPETDERPWVGKLVIGLLLASIGVYLFAVSLEVAISRKGGGEEIVPMTVGGILSVIGLHYLWRAIRGKMDK